VQAYLKNPVFKLIASCADELGVQAYVIGGFVRDIFLERESKDIDVVTIGKELNLLNWFIKN
jgi:poly(A) polymerase